jgi:hypothetical protein
MAVSESLQKILRKVPDPRQASGQRHPLPAVLTLLVVAVLAGVRSQAAVVQFGRDRGRGFCRLLGFKKGQCICPAMLHYLLKRLEAAAFETAIRQWLGRVVKNPQALCLDGKTLGGTTCGGLPGVHLLSVYAAQEGVALARLPVGAKTNEHKAALENLKILPLKGAVVTGDAIFCQRDLSAEVVRNGGDYLWMVKANQPALREAIARTFAAPGPAKAFPPYAASAGSGARRG